MARNVRSSPTCRRIRLAMPECRAPAPHTRTLATCGALRVANRWRQLEHDLPHGAGRAPGHPPPGVDPSGGDLQRAQLRSVPQRAPHRRGPEPRAEGHCVQRQAPAQALVVWGGVLGAGGGRGTGGVEGSEGVAVASALHSLVSCPSSRPTPCACVARSARPAQPPVPGSPHASRPASARAHGLAPHVLQSFCTASGCLMRHLQGPQALRTWYSGDRKRETLDKPSEIVETLREATANFQSKDHEPSSVDRYCRWDRFFHTLPWGTGGGRGAWAQSVPQGNSLLRSSSGWGQTCCAARGGPLCPGTPGLASSNVPGCKSGTSPCGVF